MALNAFMKHFDTLYRPGLPSQLQVCWSSLCNVWVHPPAGGPGLLPCQHPQAGTQGAQGGEESWILGVSWAKLLTMEPTLLR